MSDVVLTLQYLPANGAWMILWHDQRIAGPMSGDAVRSWMTDHGIDPGEINVPGHMRSRWVSIAGAGV